MESSGNNQNDFSNPNIFPLLETYGQALGKPPGYVCAWPKDVKAKVESLKNAWLFQLSFDFDKKIPVSDIQSFYNFESVTDDGVEAEIYIVYQNTCRTKVNTNLHPNKIMEFYTAGLNEISSSQMVWDTQVNPLTLWRLYSSAGFVPEDSIWDIDNGGYYNMYVPGVPLPSLSKFQKGSSDENMKRNNRIERHFLQNHPSNLKASFTNKYMGQLDRILHKYYNIPDPKALLKIFSRISY